MVVMAPMQMASPSSRIPPSPSLARRSGHGRLLLIGDLIPLHIDPGYQVGAASQELDLSSCWADTVSKRAWKSSGAKEPVFSHGISSYFLAKTDLLKS